jgi:hypothetical protein
MARLVNLAMNILLNYHNGFPFQNAASVRLSVCEANVLFHRFPKCQKRFYTDYHGYIQRCYLPGAVGASLVT